MDQTAETTPYERIGGEAGVRRLTRRFYELMDSLPEGAAARAIHPTTLHGSEQKLFEYLSGWLGGPPIFVERRGSPMLRARHLHVRITGAEIDAWLACFRRAWAETVDDGDLTAFVMPKIEGLARHMGNEGQALFPEPWGARPR